HLLSLRRPQRQPLRPPAERPPRGDGAGLRRPGQRPRHPRLKQTPLARRGTAMSATEVVVRSPRAEDLAEWSRLRTALWPETSAESHAEEIAAFLTGKLAGWLAGLHAVAAFVADRPGGGLCGFLEASVRPMADGCTTHPVGYVEGWFVDPDLRRRGIGRALVSAAEAWAA